MLDSHYPNGLTHGDLQHVGEIPDEQVRYKVVLLSETDFTPEIVEFETEYEANLALQDNLELIDLKASQLLEQHKELSLQIIKKVVD